MECCIQNKYVLRKYIKYLTLDIDNILAISTVPSKHFRAQRPSIQFYSASQRFPFSAGRCRLLEVIQFAFSAGRVILDDVTNGYLDGAWVVEVPPFGTRAGFAENGSWTAGRRGDELY